MLLAASDCSGLLLIAPDCFGSQVPEHLVMGLSWDITQGRNIDLDASALLLDAQMRQIDLVFFGKLGSSDGAVRHGGDEREGDEKVSSRELPRAPASSHDLLRSSTISD